MKIVKSKISRESYLAKKLRDHLNSVGYNITEDGECLIKQVLRIDGKTYDDNNTDLLILKLDKEKAKLLLNSLIRTTAKGDILKFSMELEDVLSSFIDKK